MQVFTLLLLLLLLLLSLSLSLSLLLLSMMTLITGFTSLSSDHLFQVYYKVRQVLLQSATAFFITKCDGLLLQSATACLLQSATSVITKCDRYYKVRRLLQSVTVHSDTNILIRER